MNLDNHADFKAVLRYTVDLGIFHVEVCRPRVSWPVLIDILSSKFSKIGYRNFHREILNRAYGLAFVNAKKMAWVRTKAAQENPQSV